MVGLGGLEPPTSRLSGGRSNQLSYRPGERTNVSLALKTENLDSKRPSPLVFAEQRMLIVPRQKEEPKHSGLQKLNSV